MVAGMYSSKIIKAGALLSDTKLLLEQWDVDATVTANLGRFREENLFGKKSRSRVDDVLAVFRQRYLHDPDLLAALVILAQGGSRSESLNRILYFQATLSDRLLHDVVTELLLPWSSRPDGRVQPWEVENWIAAQVVAGRTERPWSSEVQRRVMQGLLATLRDFGLLEGAVHKRITSIYLPIDAFAFTALQLRRHGLSGESLLHSSEWKLFFLGDQTIERFFLEAHQERLLQYHAAGRTTRIDFPADTLREYACVLTQRAHPPA